MRSHAWRRFELILAEVIVRSKSVRSILLAGKAIVDVLKSHLLSNRYLVFYVIYSFECIHYPIKPPSVMSSVCNVKVRISCCKGRFYLPLTFFIYAFMFLATFLLQINTNDKRMEQRQLHRQITFVLKMCHIYNISFFL